MREDNLSGQDRRDPEGYWEFFVVVVEKNEKVFRG